MAKVVSNEDDDDKFVKMDDESLGFLEQVKKGKARKFVLSMKGNKVKSLLVKKKPIKDKDRKEARGGGFQPIFGVATGTGLNITFTVARSDGFDDKTAGTKTEKLKKFLKEQTGTAYKPTFALVDAPPAVPFDDEDLHDPLIARFMKMEPVIDKACEQRPDRVTEIEGSVKEIRDLLQDDETRPQAGPRIDEFVQYLKELLSGDAAATSPPPTSASPQTDAPATDEAVVASRLVEALKRLKPMMDKVINADPNRQRELHATMAQIAGEIKARQFDQAKQNVTDFVTLLRSLVAQIGASTSSETTDGSLEFAERRDALEPRLLEAQKADREKASKLGAVWDYAHEQAQSGNFGNAFSALDGLEAAIDGMNIVGTSTAAQTTPPLSNDQASGVVAKRKYLVTRWQQVPSDLNIEIATLKDAIVELVPDEDASGISKQVDVKLHALSAKMKSEIDDALDEDINSGDSQYRRTMQAIAVVRNEVQSNPLMAALRENTLSDGQRFERAFTACLDDLSAELSR